MSLVHTLPDTALFIHSLCDICLAGAFVGCILMLCEAGFVLAFSGERSRRHAALPPVTVLKPLHGAEPGLADRLAAFCRQDYDDDVQIVCGASDAASPAIGVVRAMQREPEAGPIELHVDGRTHGSNRKVSNLINMLPHVRYD